jgi:NADPH-dependent 2,4-dienoyl-CoA reductase/sulfur reductase-like enzyme
VAHYRGATALRAEGEGRIEALSFTAGGRSHRVAAAALMIHTGVVPNVQLTRSLNLEHDWDPLQHCWRPRIDGMGRTSAEGILVAGDSAGIAGADAAVPAGRLAAIAALEALGRAPRASAYDTRKALDRQLAPRAFLDALYAPAPEFLDPPDETVVCRCEEVTAGQIRGFVDLGCLGPNQAKAYGRCGMGPCQGRYCGLTVSHVIAARRGCSVPEVGHFRIRPPIKPVTIGELAAMDPDAMAESDGGQPAS